MKANQLTATKSGKALRGLTGSLIPRQDNSTAKLYIAESGLYTENHYGFRAFHRILTRQCRDAVAIVSLLMKGGSEIDDTTMFNSEICTSLVRRHSIKRQYQ